MQKILLICRAPSLVGVNAVKNYIYFSSRNDNIDLTIFCIQNNDISTNIDEIRLQTNFKGDIQILNLFGKTRSSIKKVIMYTKYFLFGRNLSLLENYFDNIIVVGDSSLYFPLISKSLRWKKLTFWMLELPLIYTKYYSKFIRNILYAIENTVIKNANNIIIPNIERKDFLMDKKNFFAKNIFVITNYPFINDLFSRQTEVRNIPFTISAKYVCFTGYISPQTIPLSVLKTIFSEIYNDIKVSLVICGKIHPISREILEDNQNESIRYFGELRRFEVDYVQKNALAGLAFYLEDSMNHFLCAPQKIYEYLNEHIPVICTNNPPVENLLSKYFLGKTLKSLSPYEIKKTIIDLVNNHDVFSKSVKSFAEEVISEKTIEDEIQLFSKGSII